MSLGLIGMAAVFIGVGLWLARADACTGLCETAALTFLYAGGPISAAFGVVFGELVIAWPLDITYWVVAGYVVTRWAAIKDRRPLTPTTVLVCLALTYGLVLSQLVEIDV